MASFITGLSETNKLTGNNYNVWKIKMEALLRAKNAWKLTIGEEKMPNAKGDAQKNWKERNNVGVITLKLSISDYLLIYTDKLNTCSQIWETLENLYAQKNKARVVTLKEELFKLVMKETNIVVDFIHKVTTIRNELLSTREAISGKEIVEMVVGKLPNAFDMTINTITNTDIIEEISLDDLTRMLMRQEQRNNRYEDEIEDAFATRLNIGGSRGRGRFKGRGRTFEFRTPSHGRWPENRGRGHVHYKRCLSLLTLQQTWSLFKSM